MPARDTMIFFDAGFTLLRPHPSIGHFYAEEARHWGIDAPPHALDTSFFTAWRHCKKNCPAHPDVPYGRTLSESRSFWRRVVDETFRLTGHPLPGEADSLHAAIFDRFATAECWRLYPDVEAALGLAEASGASIGILSNWDLRLPLVLDSMGLAGRFRVIITSSAAGAEKPSPAIFRHAEATTPGFCRYHLIGDEPNADGHGARNAGWGVTLVGRDAPPPPEFPSHHNLAGAVELALSEG